MAAVVEIVKVVDPLPVIPAGLKVHLAKDGSPVQDAFVKFIVELYPVCPVIDRAFVALPPGALMVSAELAAVKLKSA